MNMNQILKQAQAMQKDITKQQEEVAKMTFTASKDLVTVEVNGSREVTKVTLSKDIDTDDIEMLEDMIVAAVNEAGKQIDDTLETKMNEATGGLNLNFPMF